MYYSEMVKKACNLMFNVSKEQFDKAGYPYVFHPYTVAFGMEDEATTCAALLHDVLEDHADKVTIDTLKQEGFTDEIIEALQLLNHDKSVPYMEYVKALASNPVARAVKLADLEHNMNSDRLGGTKPQKYSTYKEAFGYLTWGVSLIDLPEIAVIGKESLCTKAQNNVSYLWKEANSHFSEVASLGKKDSAGAFAGFWGAMSDETRSFKPWTDEYSRGLYLAGVEVNKDAKAPAGWVKWILPSRKYLNIDVTPDTYAAVFEMAINTILPQMELVLIGAVCDFTEPSTGKNKLFFPVAEKWKL